MNTVLPQGVISRRPGSETGWPYRDLTRAFRGKGDHDESHDRRRGTLRRADLATIIQSTAATEVEEDYQGFLYDRITTLGGAV